MKKKSMLKFMTLLVVVLFLAAGLMAGCAKKEEAKKEAPADRKSVV